MFIVKPEKSSHWYTKEGEPCYEIECSTIPGKMRKPDIRDAKKFTLFPSVTGVLDLLRKPVLEAWKINQGILSAMTLPAIPDESEPEYLKRIAQDAKSTGSDAAKLGNIIHKCTDLYDKKRELRVSGYGELDKKLEPIMRGYAPWSEKHIKKVIDSEVSFACNDGYGGRTDLQFGLAGWGGARVLADKKSRTTKPGQKVRIYPEDGLQLAAYANGRGLLGRVRLWSIIISTTEPGRIEIVDWTDKAETEYKAFQHLLEVWVHLNRHDPRSKT